MGTSQGKTAEEREARRRKLDEILNEIDAIPKGDGPNDLEWDENGLPI